MSFIELPIELLIHIIHFLPSNELEKLSSTNPLLQQLVFEEVDRRLRTDSLNKLSTFGVSIEPTRSGGTQSGGTQSGGTRSVIQNKVFNEVSRRLARAISPDEIAAIGDLIKAPALSEESIYELITAITELTDMEMMDALFEFQKQYTIDRFSFLTREQFEKVFENANIFAVDGVPAGYRRFSFPELFQYRKSLHYIAMWLIYMQH